LYKSALASIKHVRQHTSNNFVIIGVGGIQSGVDAVQMLDVGANLIQLYTGLIYSGPGLVGQINRAIAENWNDRK
jgi:dihydroorotate dehydrogenase